MHAWRLLPRDRAARRREQFLKLSVPILVVSCLKSLGVLMNFIRGIGGKLLVFGTFWKPWRKCLETFGSVSGEMEWPRVLRSCELLPRLDVAVLGALAMRGGGSIQTRYALATSCPRLLVTATSL